MSAFDFHVTRSGRLEEKRKRLLMAVRQAYMTLFQSHYISARHIFALRVSRLLISACLASLGSFNYSIIKGAAQTVHTDHCQGLIQVEAWSTNLVMHWTISFMIWKHQYSRWQSMRQKTRFHYTVKHEQACRLPKIEVLRLLHDVVYPYILPLWSMSGPRVLLAWFGSFSWMCSAESNCTAEFSISSPGQAWWHVVRLDSTCHFSSAIFPWQSFCMVRQSSLIPIEYYCQTASNLALRQAHSQRLSHAYAWSSHDIYLTIAKLPRFLCAARGSWSNFIQNCC